MKKQNELFTATNIWRALIILFFVFSAAYAYFNNKNTIAALKDSSEIKALITLKSGSRGGTIYDVDYHFDGHLIRKDFTLQSDSLNVGDSVILRVSNQHPRDYFVFVRRIK